MASIVECNDVQKALASLLPAESDTTSSRSTSPSQDEILDSPLDGLVDDVWKDLCLMPTPPMSSPEYSQMSRPPSPVANSPNCSENEYSEALLALDLLEQVRAYEDASSLLSDAQAICEHNELIIQDCMWSGAYGGGIGCKELVGETSTPTITSGHVSEEQPSCSESDAESSQQECVEPSAVFPALRTDQRHLLLQQQQQIAPRPTGRSSRGAMAISESEEEIDVVTIEQKADSREASHHHQSRASQQQQLTHRKVSRGLTTTANSFRRKKHSKRFSRISSHDPLESDDEARRASHNVLERKRRNDLKNSFDILRSRIPELEENQRAPKVIILRKATEYIKAMQVSEKRTNEELLREKARHIQLMEKLARLKTLRSI